MVMLFLREPLARSAKLFTRIEHITVDARGSDGQLIGSSPAKLLVTAEIPDKDVRYVLADGQWYSVSHSFVSALREDIRNIENATPAINLPPLFRREKVQPVGDFDTEHETIYNARVAKSNNRFVSIDCKLFYESGIAGGIEPCDLFTEDGMAICVKKRGASATLSHLLAQASVSARLFSQNQKYRELLYSLVSPKWPGCFDVADPDNRKIRYVYAIATDSPDMLCDALPFFTLVNIRTHILEIQSRQFRVGICKFGYDTAPPKYVLSPKKKIKSAPV